MKFLSAFLLCVCLVLGHAQYAPCESVPVMAPFDEQIVYSLENALSYAYKLGDQEMIAKIQGLGIKLESPPEQMEHMTEYNVKEAVRHIHGSLAHALKSSAITGDLDIFKKVHAIGGNINGGEDQSQPPIIDAIQANSGNIIAYILASEDFDVNKCGVNRYSALQIAAEEGNMKLVKLLVERGAKLDGCYGKGDGTSPYLEAVSSGEFEICKFLLQKGADGSFYDWKGENALTKAISKRVPLDFIKFTVKNGADVNTKSHAGTEIETTPLIRAADVGRKDIVDYLISIGADPSYKDPKGKTAQDYLNESTMK